MSVGSTETVKKKRWHIYIGVIGAILGIAMAVGVVYYYEYVQRFES